MITYLLFQCYKRHKILKKSLQQRVRSTTRIIIIIIITIALKSNVTQSKIKKKQDMAVCIFVKHYIVVRTHYPLQKKISSC